MRREKHEEAQEGEIVETHWDLRKIGIGFTFLVLLIIAGSYILKFQENTGMNQKTNVLGTSHETKEVPPLPDKGDIESIITDAKDTLSQITSDNLISSQAAIQKIIADLQSLQGKSGAVGLICKALCKDK